MTALIAAMNKSAVALAADSALTINYSSSHKVLNCANKLFELSPNHSIGMMFCGNATYMKLPWEVIIKEFGKSLGTNQLPHVHDYKYHFIQFLINNDHFCRKEWQERFLIKELIRLNNILSKPPKENPTDEEIKNSFILAADDIINDTAEEIEGLVGYSYDDFIIEYGPTLKATCNALSLIQKFPELEKKLLRCFHKFLLRDNSILGSTNSQIVIAGYGSNDIMPKLTSFNIWFGLGKRVRYDKYIIQEVTEENDSCVSRYAQTDIINTFINGIHPKLKELISTNIPGVLSKVLDQVSTTIADPGIKDSVKNYDITRFTKLFTDLIDRNSREQFTTPLVNTIALLDIPDLIAFVESLISLTGLHRRMVGMEEGVGGPVDVAVITKAKGFSWVKQKSFY